MKNSIDKIITLSNNDEYMIMDQANYNGKAYYLLSKLDSEKNLTEEFDIVENNDGHISSVEESALKNALVEYFKKRNNN